MNSTFIKTSFSSIRNIDSLRLVESKVRSFMEDRLYTQIRLFKESDIKYGKNVIHYHYQPQEVEHHHHIYLRIHFYYDDYKFSGVSLNSFSLGAPNTEIQSQQMITNGCAEIFNMLKLNIKDFPEIEFKCDDDKRVRYGCPYTKMKLTREFSSKNQMIKILVPMLAKNWCHKYLVFEERCALLAYLIRHRYSTDLYLADLQDIVVDKIASFMRSIPNSTFYDARDLYTIFAHHYDHPKSYKLYKPYKVPTTTFGSVSTLNESGN